MEKKFLISIDTEGDNLWKWKQGDEIKTENARFLPRFQTLCDKYGFKPTYLTNYEMACDDYFVSFAGEAAKDGRCEIGMHLHAWNCPPEYPLKTRDDVTPGAPYLIEYPEKIMDEKVAFMTQLLTEKFGTAPVTHRAGRWAMNDTYFRILDKYGYKTDCSVTPGKSWKHAAGQSPDSMGSDYTDSPVRPYEIDNTGIIEVPVTVRENHRLHHNPGEGIKKAIRNRYRSIKGQGKIWLRPDGRNIDDLLYLTNLIAESPRDDYLMFMLHSSEFMPGCNPRFSTEHEIDSLYNDLECLFDKISEKFDGITIGNYSASIEKRNLRR